MVFDQCYLCSSVAKSSARVAQLMERWSYKPEVEGLSPSLGTKNQKAENSKQQPKCLRRLLLSAYCLLPTDSRGVTHPGRTVTVWERGVRRGAGLPHAPSKLLAADERG